MTDLSAEEVCDLFLAAKLAEEVAEAHFGATSSTMSVQDGAEAGQTVEHVHVHVLPRREGDFKENDDVYTALATHDRKGDHSHMTSAKFLGFLDPLPPPSPHFTQPISIVCPRNWAILEPPSPLCADVICTYMVPSCEI